MRTLLMYLTVVAAALTACAPLPKQVNFDHMRFDERGFDFRHNIELFEISNGMRVALIPDPSTNLATIDLRFDVGATEDPAGRTGMAHLVEHLAFEYRGSPGGPTINDELEQLTLYANAATSWDYTHFTETALIENLGKLIVLEGRRMKATCDQLDEATFRRELDVVMQEERQRHNPLSLTMLEVIGEVYGADHPYARPLSSSEIAGATREEFCAFVTSHYTPDRASLVITGNFAADQVRGLVGKTFGPVTRQAGPRAAAVVAHFDGKVTRHDAAVDHPTAVVMLPYPAWGGDDVVLWEVVTSQLSGALSRADQKYPWMTNTAVFPWSVERARVLVVVVEVDDEAKLDRAVEEVFARSAALDTDLSPDAVRRLVAAKSLDYVSSWDRREGRGAWISMFMQYTDDNWFMLRELKALYTADYKERLPEIAGKLRRAGSHVAYLVPAAPGEVAVADAVPATPHPVSPWRAPVEAGDADRPVKVPARPPRTTVEFELGNGLHVVLAPSPDSQLVDARVVFPVGSAHDPANQPYLAMAAAGLLGLDTERLYPPPVAAALNWVLEKDTVLDVEVDETSTTFITRGSALWGDWHVWLLSWWLDAGNYHQRTLQLTRRAAEALAETEGKTDASNVDRTRLERLYGAGHPYADPPPVGSALMRLDAGDLWGWKRAHFRPRGATLVVSGGFDPGKMRAEIEEMFGRWPDVETAPLPEIGGTSPADHPSWFAVPAPAALQTRVTIDIPAGSDRIADEAARHVLVAMLDDELRDLREGMGATYGVDVSYYGGPAGGYLHISSLLDETRSPEAAQRMLAIVDRMAQDAAGQRESFVRARKKVLALSLARSGGASAVADELEWSFERRHGAGHADDLAQRIATLTPAALAKVAAADLGPARRLVLVRGKQAAIDLVYQRLAVTPEVLEETPAKPAADDDPPAAGAASTTASAPTRGADELFLGNEQARAGHEPGAYYLGDRQLTLDQFLDTAGASDVKHRFHRRRWIKRGLFWGGLTGMFGGGLLFLLASGCDDGSFPNQAALDDCRSTSDTQKTVGTAFAATGLIMTIANLKTSDRRPSDEELMEIASRYNRRTIGMVPVALPGGAQLVLTGSF